MQEGVQTSMMEALRDVKATDEQVAEAQREIDGRIAQQSEQQGTEPPPPDPIELSQRIAEQTNRLDVLSRNGNYEDITDEAFPDLDRKLIFIKRTLGIKVHIEYLREVASTANDEETKAKWGGLVKELEESEQSLLNGGVAKMKAPEKLPFKVGFSQ